MASASSLPFVQGRIYNRKNDLHLIFGGSGRSGIAPCANSPFVFLFTGRGGKKHGYNDEWHNGVFLYSGEGQVGNQTMKVGNEAIRTHVERGRDLLLFTNVKNGVRFEGIFHYAGHHIARGRDRNNKLRNLIIFHLIQDQPQELLPDFALPKRPISAKHLRALRDDAYSMYAKSKENVATSVKLSLRIDLERSGAVRRYVLARANGICESCRKPAPFKRTNGSPYLESHHIHKLSEDGSDRPDHVAAICPTCHRRIHFGKDGKHLDNQLFHVVQDKEKLGCD